MLRRIKRIHREIEDLVWGVLRVDFSCLLTTTGRHDMIVFRKGEAPKLEIQTKISLETVGPEFLVVQIRQCLSQQGNGTTLPKCVRGHSSVPGLARSIATSI